MNVTPDMQSQIVCTEYDKKVWEAKARLAALKEARESLGSSYALSELIINAQENLAELTAQKI